MIAHPQRSLEPRVDTKLVQDLAYMGFRRPQVHHHRCGNRLVLQAVGQGFCRSTFTLCQV